MQEGRNDPEVGDEQPMASLNKAFLMWATPLVCILIHPFGNLQ